jgi:hypothetical protein
MLRLARVIAIAAASGVFLAIPPLATHAAVPSSSCIPSSTGYPVTCTLYESLSGAPSEVSDVVSTQLVVPSGIAVLLENPNGSQTDLTNWSDVIEFLPQAPGSPNSLSVQFLSEGCGNLQNPFDVSCFPSPPQVEQFILEVQTGVGDDFRDCTSFPVLFQGLGISQDAVIRPQLNQGIRCPYLRYRCRSCCRSRV